jgi:hypothetical protein
MAFTTIDPSLTPSVQQNLLINGGFEIWQRGTSFSMTNSGIYTADRWKFVTNAGPTGTMSQESGAGNVDLGNYAMKWVISTVGGATSTYIEQRVENYKDYFGKTVTVSIRVKSTSSSFLLQIAEANVGGTSVTSSGSGNWETLTVTRTFGSSGTGLVIQFGFVGVTPVAGTYYIDSAMLVLGSQPATYVSRPFAQELAMCQRYFYTTQGPATAQALCAEHCQSTTICYGSFYFPVTMYSAPTPTVVGTAFQVYTAAGGSTAATPSFSTATPNSVFVAATTSAVLVAGNASVLYSTNAATGYLTFQAEL